MKKLLSAIGVAIPAALGIWWLTARNPVVESRPSSLQPSAALTVENPRPQYRHSVIPGGVRDRAELTERLHSDPVAAAHYDDVPVNKLQPVHLNKPRTAYVSYRRNGSIYWTSKPIQVPAGELVLEGDGETVRSRCGNRLSDTRRFPIAKVEPPLEELDIPEFAAASGPLVLPSQFWPELVWPGAPGSELQKLAMVTMPPTGVDNIGAYAGLTELGSGPAFGSASGAGGGGGGGLSPGGGTPNPGVDTPGTVDSPPSGGGPGGGPDGGGGNPPPPGGGGPGPSGGTPEVPEPPKPGGGNPPVKEPDKKNPGFDGPPPVPTPVPEPPALPKPPTDKPPTDKPPGPPPIPDDFPPGPGPKWPPADPEFPDSDVPEPSTLVLAGVALAALVAFRRR